MCEGFRNFATLVGAVQERWKTWREVELIVAGPWGCSLKMRQAVEKERRWGSRKRGNLEVPIHTRVQEEALQAEGGMHNGKDLQAQRSRVRAQ